VLTGRREQASAGERCPSGDRRCSGDGGRRSSGDKRCSGSSFEDSATKTINIEDRGIELRRNRDAIEQQKIASGEKNGEEPMPREDRRWRGDGCHASATWAGRLGREKWIITLICGSVTMLGIVLTFIWGPKDWIYTCTRGGEYTKNPLKKYNNRKD
jgi:hypothetical protein